MLATASIGATDALERHLVPPGFEWCERELLGRSWRRDWGMHNFPHFPDPEKFPVSELFFRIGCSGLAPNMVWGIFGPRYEPSVVPNQGLFTTQYFGAKFWRQIYTLQSRCHEHPRSSRLEHSNPGGASCLSTASVAQIIGGPLV